EILMPTYIMLVNFTDQGRKGVKEVPNRQDKSREVAKQFGVERRTVWMTFGPYDFVHVYEAPDDEAMAKFVMTLASFGNIRTTVMRAWAGSAHLPLIRARTAQYAERAASFSHFCLDRFKALRAPDADFVLVLLQARDQPATAWRNAGAQPRDV